MTPDELRQELAVMLYSRNRFTMGQACSLACMDRLSFQHLLASRQIAQHYDAEAFAEDMVTLRDSGLA